MGNKRGGRIGVGKQCEQGEYQSPHNGNAHTVLLRIKGQRYTIQEGARPYLLCHNMYLYQWLGLTEVVLSENTDRYQSLKHHFKIKTGQQKISKKFVIVIHIQSVLIVCDYSHSHYDYVSSSSSSSSSVAPQPHKLALASSTILYRHPSLFLVYILQLLTPVFLILLCIFKTHKNLTKISEKKETFRY